MIALLGITATAALDLSVAPMMGHTHRHHRVFWRLLSERTEWWSEMVPAPALLAGAGLTDDADVDPDLVAFANTRVDDDPRAVLQLGGCDAAELRDAAGVAASLGYRHLNLNCGCPSSRVTDEEYRSGAALIRDAARVGELCRAMAAGAPGALISVKHRLGVVDFKDYDADDDARHGLDRARATASDFVRTVAETSDVKRFVVHARLALLGDLDPDSEASSRLLDKARASTDDRLYRDVASRAASTGRASTLTNRHVPPLRRSVVDDLSRRFPDLDFVVNGGFASMADVLDQTRDAMVGRAAINHPCSFAAADAALYGAAPAAKTRGDVLDAYIAYCESQKLDRPATRRKLLSPAYHLFAGEPGNARYQRRIKKLAGTKLGRGAEAHTILRAARREVEASLATPVSAFCAPDEIPTYELESPRAGPLQRLVR